MGSTELPSLRRARLRQGRTPSISTSSEKLRSVRTRTISASTSTLLQRGLDGDGANEVGSDECLEAEQDPASEIGTHAAVHLGTGNAAPQPDDPSRSREKQGDDDDRDADPLDHSRDVVHGLHARERLPGSPDKLALAVAARFSDRGQRRRPVINQEREPRATPLSSLECAASISRRRSTARAASLLLMLASAALTF